MKKLVQENAKAITALLTVLVTLGVTKAGLNLPAGACAAVATVLTTGLVWAVPNKPLTYGTG